MFFNFFFNENHKRRCRSFDADCARQNHTNLGTLCTVHAAMGSTSTYAQPHVLADEFLACCKWFLFSILYTLTANKTHYRAASYLSIQTARPLESSHSTAHRTIKS